MTRLVDYKGAAEILAMSPAAVRNLVHRGVLPCVRFGSRTVRLSVDDLERFIAASRVEARR